MNLGFIRLGCPTPWWNEWDGGHQPLSSAQKAGTVLPAGKPSSGFLGNDTLTDCTPWSQHLSLLRKEPQVWFCLFLRDIKQTKPSLVWLQQRKSSGRANPSGPLVVRNPRGAGCTVALLLSVGCSGIQASLSTEGPSA